MFKWYMERKAKKFRTYRTLLIATQINSIISEDVPALVETSEFIDSNHIQEVANIAARLKDVPIEAAATRDVVAFHCVI